MKTAIVQDWLTTLAGAERVLAAIYDIWPSPIYTLVKNEQGIRGAIFEQAEIHTSFIQKLPWATQKYRNYLLLFPLAIEQFDLSDYDLIISSSYSVAKGVLTNSAQLHICYCHTPARYAWDLYHPYLNSSGINRGARGWLARMVLHYLRIWDIASSNRVDSFVANSQYIARRIKKIYGREATVIYPPVDIDKFELTEERDNFYISVSRAVPYKKLDLIIEAFSKMPDRRLIVIGDGPDFKKLKSKATKNIELLGYQPLEVIKEYLQRAKAFVFAAEEDFGIAPVEAQACGTPVIAFGRGGIREAVLEGTGGLFFNQQRVDSLIEAVKGFERIEDKFDPYKIRKSVERFNRERFKREFKGLVDEKLEARR